MELVSLHPVDPALVGVYVEALQGKIAPPAEWVSWWDDDLADAVESARSGNERAANRLTYGLALALTVSHPVFAHNGFGLSVWEARIDRGVGMYMRPPSRLFGEAGMAEPVSRSMPIRLDLQRGMMGGAWVPARLIPDLERLLDSRLERIARRLHEGEYDTYGMLGLMFEAVNYARENRLGLFEAMDVIGPDGEAFPGAIVMAADRKRIPPELRLRIDTAIKPARKPGLVSRMFRRSGPATFSANGHTPDDPTPHKEERS